MVRVLRIKRRSSVLTPSSLACLSRMPTINLTAGCAVGCVYCYTVGYSSYPGEGTIVLYANTLEQLQAELGRKRIKPQTVFFSPSCDLFQPVPEVLELGYQVLEFLFDHGIAATFLTKGEIPWESMRLLLDHSALVKAQIGITTLDKEVASMFEPNAAAPDVRLRQIGTLLSGGIAVEARLDPILPGLTDTPDCLRTLFSALAAAGVKRAAASVLFLRPGIVGSLKRHLPDEEALQALLAHYNEAKRLPIRAEHSSVTTLPAEARTAIYQRVELIAKEHLIELALCACKNPDLARGTCHISGSWTRRPRKSAQPRLFGQPKPTTV